MTVFLGTWKDTSQLISLSYCQFLGQIFQLVYWITPVCLKIVIFISSIHLFVFKMFLIFSIQLIWFEVTLSITQCLFSLHLQMNRSHGNCSFDYSYFSSKWLFMNQYFCLVSECSICQSGSHVYLFSWNLWSIVSVTLFIRRHIKLS